MALSGCFAGRIPDRVLAISGYRFLNGIRLTLGIEHEWLAGCPAGRAADAAFDFLHFA